ncbi:MAG: glycogen synthase [Oscillospiraceae bacterium]|nr:glycogen synthase [Oscillospiraceae bacterium]
MKIAMIASEAAPFIKTGGLGDVLQALPAELSRIKGNQIAVFLPYYKKIKYNPAIETELVTAFTVNLTWRQQYAGLFRWKGGSGNLQIYFLDNEFYFCRDGIYGFYDDGERFAYFAKAVLAAMARIELRPEILHCHDWQTGLVPIYLEAEFRDRFPSTRTVFTIHNVEYQGKTGPEFFNEVLGLDDRWRGVCSFDGCINFMKAAVVQADLVTTVSETYATELRYPYFAHGLSGVLASRGEKLRGITNGIDVSVYDPAADPAIAQNYSAADPSGKRACKRALQQELGLAESDAPILAMVTRLASHKGIDILCYILRRLLERELQLVIVGTGEAKYEHALNSVASEYPGKFSMNLRFDSALASRVYAGADIYLMPSRSEPCGLSQLIAMHYGAVPVVNATGGLKDTVPPFNPDTGEGRGYTFQSYNGDDFLGAIDRALGDYYNNRAAWEALVRADMETDFSWQAPAQKYMELYCSLI